MENVWAGHAWAGHAWAEHAGGPGSVSKEAKEEGLVG